MVLVGKGWYGDGDGDAGEGVWCCEAGGVSEDA